jgi:uncharacterized membrane protein YsdA (DUF1294 family)
MSAPNLTVCVIAYGLIVNLVTFTVFAADKRLAIEHRGRVPERTLLRLAAAGGSVGAVLAQQILRHKTRKQPFRGRLIGVIVAQLLAALGLCAWLAAH